MLVHHKWFIRAGLAVFWVAEIVAYAFDRGFITALLTHHTWGSLILFFLTFKYLVEPFYAPFLKITKKGGEVVMEKSTKILLVLAALLGALVVAMAIEPSRTIIIDAFKAGVLNPIYTIGVGFNSWLATYPSLWVLGSGLLGGLVLAIIINRVALPKIRSRKETKPAKEYLGGPDYVPPSVVPKSTAIPSKNPDSVKTESDQIVEEATA